MQVRKWAVYKTESYQIVYFIDLKMAQRKIQVSYYVEQMN